MKPSKYIRCSKVRTTANKGFKIFYNLYANTYSFKIINNYYNDKLYLKLETANRYSRGSKIA